MNNEGRDPAGVVGITAPLLMAYWSKRNVVVALCSAHFRCEPELGLWVHVAQGNAYACWLSSDKAAPLFLEQMLNVGFSMEPGKWNLT